MSRKLLWVGILGVVWLGALVIASLEAQPNAAAFDFAGTWKCQGTDVSGRAYAGTVEIAKMNEAYQARWSLGEFGTFTGVGIRTGNVLSLSWVSGQTSGVLVYEAQADGTLKGSWALHGGKGSIQQEQLTRTKVDAAPVAELKDVPAKASVNGKYKNLLKVIKVPADVKDYGEFSDFGQYAGTSWAGHENLPPGYWVYVAPNWYIWGALNNAGNQEAAKPELQLNEELRKKASVSGKYKNLLKVIEVAGDRDGFGEFNDWGHWTGNEWAGHQNLPEGHWVYVFPRWYIWRDAVREGNGGAQPAVDPKLQRASVNGKYKNLLKVIEVANDQKDFGAFHEWGHWTGTEWAGFQNLPQGYWVYVAPNWYIWGNEAK